MTARIASAGSSANAQPPSVHDRWGAVIRRCGKRLGLALPDDYAGDEPPLTWARRHAVPNHVVCEAAAELLGVPYYAEPEAWQAVEGFVDRYPIAHSRRHGLVALVTPEHGPRLILGEPASEPQLDAARRLLGAELGLAFAPLERVNELIDEVYGRRSGQAETLLETLDRGEVMQELAALTDREDLLDSSGRAPVIKLVNMVLHEAVKAGASDVHVQPGPSEVVVRMRIDGVLFDSLTIPKHLQDEVLSRLKVQGRMNIAEKRLPQDGRATVRVGERMIDLRIASLPGSDGERIVVRLLDKSAKLYTLPQVGMDRANLEVFERLIRLEHGLILVTGPTGSGKSTTLYAALQEINTTDRNVVTLEDPIEYEIRGVSQTQINVKKGMTFATGLRNVLRQDPDIIMVGEIRDHETAVMAIQSALTGHLVFSTLHTNDAASAVTRLLDLGIEPYLVSSSLLAVLAQRLTRRVCSECAQPRDLTDTETATLGVEPDQLVGATPQVGEGCESCRGTGYRGRLGVFELLVVDEPVREAVQSRASATEIRGVAMDSGMRLLRSDGADKVLAGQTTPEEVERVTVRAAL